MGKKKSKNVGTKKSKTKQQNDDIDDLLKFIDDPTEPVQKTMPLQPAKAPESEKLKETPKPTPQRSKRGPTRGGRKGPSSIAQKILERKKRMEMAQERLKRQEEEQRRLEEERIEQERKEEEERIERLRAKKREEKEKIAAMKKAGTYLTPEQIKKKEEAERTKQEYIAVGLINPNYTLAKKSVKKKKSKKLPSYLLKTSEKNDQNEKDQKSERESENNAQDKEKGNGLESKLPQKQEENEKYLKGEESEESYSSLGDWDDSEESSAEETKVAKPAQNNGTTEKAKKVQEIDSKNEKIQKSKESLRTKDGKPKPAIKNRKGAKNKNKKSDPSAELRSPICCVLGHVDTGKTKLLDRMRSSSVQDNEVGGITQQIGASFFPLEFIKNAARRVEISSGTKTDEYKCELPGLLVIDTPGHESFSNLRKRGSTLCDIAVLVVDIMHGIEPQTKESVRLLKAKKTPFIIALNKIDKIFDWKKIENEPFESSFKKQGNDQKLEFRRRMNETILQINALGLNCALYTENPNEGSYVSMVPTSAFSGEGIPDLIWLLVRLTQTKLRHRLELLPKTECSVLEVRQDEGLGYTADLILSNGSLRVGDRILLSGLNGAIDTHIKGIYMPSPLKETRFKGDFKPVTEARAAAGLKIAASDLEMAVAGSNVLVVHPGDDVNELKEEVMASFADIFEKIDASKPGVHVQASTLGSLEAFLEYLLDEKIPVCSISLGPVHKKDVMAASVMIERKAEYAVVLAFNVKVDREATALANTLGVTVFTGEIIYNLRDAFVEYLVKKKEELRSEEDRAVMPVLLSVIPEFVIMKHNPLILGCKVEGGRLAVGTPLVAIKTEKQMKLNFGSEDKSKYIPLGIVESIELDKKSIKTAKLSTEVAVKIVPSPAEAYIYYGRQFDSNNKICSHLTRRSIDALKEEYRDELTKEEWKLVIELKRVFGIM